MDSRCCLCGSRSSSNCSIKRYPNISNEKIQLPCRVKSVLCGGGGDGSLACCWSFVLACEKLQPLQALSRRLRSVSDRCHKKASEPAHKCKPYRLLLSRERQNPGVCQRSLVGQQPPPLSRCGLCPTVLVADFAGLSPANSIREARRSMSRPIFLHHSLTLRYKSIATYHPCATSPFLIY